MDPNENPLANVPNKLIRDLLKRVKIQENRNFVMNAVKKEGTHLQYAAQELKDDRDIVMHAIKQNWIALQYASDKLKDDYEINVAIAQYKKADEWRPEQPSLGKRFSF